MNLSEFATQRIRNKARAKTPMIAWKLADKKHIIDVSAHWSESKENKKERAKNCLHACETTTC